MREAEDMKRFSDDLSSDKSEPNLSHVCYRDSTVRKTSLSKCHWLVSCCAHFSALGSNQSSGHLSHTGAELPLSTARSPQLQSIID